MQWFPVEVRHTRHSGIRVGFLIILLTSLQVLTSPPNGKCSHCTVVRIQPMEHCAFRISKTARANNSLRELRFFWGVPLPHIQMVLTLPIRSEIQDIL